MSQNKTELHVRYLLSHKTATSCKGKAQRDGHHSEPLESILEERSKDTS